MVTTDRFGSHKIDPSSGEKPQVVTHLANTPGSDRYIIFHDDFLQSFLL